MATPSSLALFASPEPDELEAAELGVLSPALAAREPHLARQLRRGVWKRYGRVVVLHNGPLTVDQFVWTSILRAPRGTVLAGATVLHQSALAWPAPPRLQLLSPFAGPTADLPGVRGRRSKVLGPEDVHPTAQPPQSRLARAVVDHLRDLRTSADVRALLCAPVQRRLLRPEHLLAAVERSGSLRHRRLVLATMEDLAGGSHSRREVELLELVRRAGLPLPDRQVVRVSPSGTRYLDAVWDEWGLHVEVDGLDHLVVAVWSADCDRANELELGKTQERRLRIPGFWLDERREHVVDQVRRGLRAGGWPG